METRLPTPQAFTTNSALLLPALFSSGWTGALNADDPFDPNFDGRYSEDFLLRGWVAGETVTLDLTSSGDPILQLINAETGDVIVLDDDSGEGLNAQISFIPEAGGNYLVRATTYGVGVEETFNLMTSRGALASATAIQPQPFQLGSGTFGTLSTSDAQVDGRESYYDAFSLTNLTAGDFVEVGLFSNDFDAYLEVFDVSQGIWIGLADDTPYNFNSEFGFYAEDGGDYLVRVGSFGDWSTGNYEISFSASQDLSESQLLQGNPFHRYDLTVAESLNSSIDGFGNNFAFASRGGAGTALGDRIAPAYGDGVSTPAGANRPNARVISNTLGVQNQPMPEPRGLTNLIWAWGQFLDHDISLTPDDSDGESVTIDVPANDPNLALGNRISLQPSSFIEGTGTGPNNPRQLPNEITTWVDGSNVYGSDFERADALRLFQRGRMRVSAGDLLPFNTDLNLPNETAGRDNRPFFVAGDVRANENSVLSSIHTLFVREHNRIASLLEDLHPTWSDEQLYQRARQINIAQIQNITFNEYLPTLIGEELETYQGYNVEVDPSIDRIFSNAAYRLGHTQLSSEIPRLTVEGQSADSTLLLADVFFASPQLLANGGMDDILRGMASSLSQQVDNALIDDVRNLLFGDGPNAPARDLMAINIERGRLNGVADYNTVRESYGLSRVLSFAEITSDVQKQQQLAQLYGTVDNIDAFVGLLAEDLRPGGSVGETTAVILRDQFARLRDGDRFYFENALAPQEAAIIRGTTFSEIIRRNTNTSIIQDNAFSLHNTGSDLGETLNGGLGDDRILGQGGDDQIFGYAGADVLLGGNGHDQIEAGRGDDQIFGNAGNDQMRGQQGNDVLVGGAGNDWLSGDSSGQGSAGQGQIDVLVGGAGADVFQLGDAGAVYYVDGDQNSPGRDDYALVTDFVLGEDQIALQGLASQYGISYEGSGVNATANLFYRVAGQADELIGIIQGASDQLAMSSNSFIFL